MAQDIGLLLRGLGAAFDRRVPEFRQELAQEQEARYLQQQREDQARKQQYERQEAINSAFAQDVMQGQQLLKQGNFQALFDLSRSTAQSAELLGLPTRPPAEIAMLSSKAMAGDSQAIAQLEQRLGSYAQQYQRYMPKTEAPKALTASNVVETAEGPMFAMQQPDGTVKMVPAGYTAAAKPDDELATETSEARNFIRSNVTDINKNITEITTAYEKVTSLEPEMRKGNRSAINAAIMNVARLISPGVVTDRDAAAFSGANTSVGAIYEFLTGKGVDVTELVRIYDPANPEIFDPDALLSVAKSVTASALPSQLARFEDQKTIAGQYDLGPRFVNSFLNSDSNLMKAAQKIQQSLNANVAQAQTTQQSGMLNFRTEAEAQAAVDSGDVPIGAVINIVDMRGNVVDSFRVEE